MNQTSAPRLNPMLRGIMLAVGLIAAMAGAASADPLVITLRTCTTLNCSALIVPALINGHPTSPPSATQWVGQFSGSPTGCLRFQVVSATTGHDLAMSVVAPDGAVYTNNDGGVAPCTTCPKVVVGTAKNGYYTVIVADAAATPAAQTYFTLRAGIYDTGNAPNCTGPTPGK